MHMYQQVTISILIYYYKLRLIYYAQYMGIVKSLKILDSPRIDNYRPPTMTGFGPLANPRLCVFAGCDTVFLITAWTLSHCQ